MHLCVVFVPFRRDSFTLAVWPKLIIDAIFSSLGFADSFQCNCIIILWIIRALPERLIRFSNKNQMWYTGTTFNADVGGVQSV